MLILYLCSFSNYRKESKMSQAPVSNCASHDIMIFFQRIPPKRWKFLSSPTGQVSHGEMLVIFSQNWRKSLAQTKTFLALSCQNFLAAMTMYRVTTPLTICQFQMAIVISLVFSSAQRVSTLTMMYVMSCQKATL